MAARHVPATAAGVQAAAHFSFVPTASGMSSNGASDGAVDAMPDATAPSHSRCGQIALQADRQSHLPPFSTSDSASTWEHST